MLRNLAFGIAVSTIALATALAPQAAVAKPADAPAAKPAPVSELIAAVDIPYQRFTLANGLRVIVHTDRKAPVVAVSVWYDVGSKMEPIGKTGFAHLFEHLMFNGTENVPGDFFEPLKQVGATDLNGSTWFDRTNYYETVPTSALDVALFLESDRMGHLLGAVSQEILDNQRAVVQNEKRQGDNQPYGLVEYAQLKGLLPADHPYGHSTIGSMADLDQASLADVKQWFIDHYGPNNAVLVLAGDIDVATAKPLVEKWFGAIPAGKPAPKVVVPIPTLPTRQDMVMKDRVATTRLYRYWTVPGTNDPQAVPLEVGASVLGGLASSRLDNILVRKEQLAVRVTADYQDFAQLGFVEVTVDVKPGIDPDTVSKRLDAILTDYIAKGPTEDEVQRVATSYMAARISGLEQVGGSSGKAVALAESELYSNDPDFYKKQLAQLATTTPTQVTTALQKWLSRPVLAIRVVPGERDPYDEAIAREKPKPAVPDTSAKARPAKAKATGPAPTAAAVPAGPDRSKLPPVGQIPDIAFPAVESATLSNGIKVHFAHRDTVPTLRLSMVFDAGYAADAQDRLGTQSMMLAMLDEGTKTRSAVQIAEEEERLGASISETASMDRTRVALFAPMPNLAPALDLLADIVKNPAFAPADLERVRGQQLAVIAQEMTSPGGLAQRTLPPVVYGRDHPYGKSFTGSGDPAVVKAITPQDLASFHRKWIRADNVEIFAVGATSLADLKPLLEARFGLWRMTRDLPGKKVFPVSIPAAQPGVILVNRPQSPQSLIVGAELLNLKGTDDLVDLITANDVLGGDFLSRINMDLREAKGWSYGVNGNIRRMEDRSPYIVTAPVQADKTGPAIAAVRQQFDDFLKSKGITPAELTRTVNGSIREMAGSFETSSDVLEELERDALYRRPFTFVNTLPGRYRAMSAPQLDAAARKAIDPAKFVWVVVGDRDTVLPQLQGLGLPVTVVEPAKVQPVTGNAGPESE